MEGYDPVFCHIYNRGVDKRSIFGGERDYLRFVGGMVKFNCNRKPGRSSDKFVDVLGYCLMPNHFHLLLRSREPEGVTDFMRRISTGYTMYFNKKYHRQGVLFESNYKSVLVEGEGQLLQLSRYIHLNPLSLVVPGWKEKGIGDGREVEAWAFLEGYAWSSLPAYLGEGEQDVADCSLLLGVIGGRENYADFMRSDLSDVPKGQSSG